MKMLILLAITMLFIGCAPARVVTRDNPVPVEVHVPVPVVDLGFRGDLYRLVRQMNAAHIDTLTYRASADDSMRAVSLDLQSCRLFHLRLKQFLEQYQ